MVKKEDDKPPTTATTTTKKNKPPRTLQSPPSSKLNQTNKSPPNSNFNSKTPNSLSTNSSIRRSTRRNPVIDHSDEDVEEEEEDDEEEDERDLKKQKLVQRLKSHSVGSAQNSRSSQVPQSRLNGVKVVEDIMDRVSGSEVKDGAGTDSRVTDAACRVLDEGSESTTPLPDKKIILFILDRLQKKDTRGVFSEPVDPEELPDYHEIIENPMDFSTVRRKLDDGHYQNLEQFEDDIFLICSNAMQYNSPTTVFFRKARAIQELAKRDFDNLRQKGEDGKPQPRVIRRGRPPRTVEKSPDQLVARQDSESPIALGSVSENSKIYNLRKGPSSSKFVTDDFMGTDEPSCNGTSVSLQEWNTEFPASILRAPYGKKPVIVDETRRETYRQPIVSHEFPATNMLLAEPKRLLPVGLGVSEHYGYPSSLARFAAGLGPVAWNLAVKKIEQSLSPGIEFDPLQFAYEGPKFTKYEVDVNLMPIFNSNPIQSSPVISHEAAVGMPRPQSNATQANGVMVGVALDPVSDKSEIPGTPKQAQAQ